MAARASKVEGNNEGEISPPHDSQFKFQPWAAARSENHISHRARNGIEKIDVQFRSSKSEFRGRENHVRADV
jgi:hypothetical protein